MVLVGQHGVRIVREAMLIARKDLRVEARSRIVLNQVAPFAVLVLVLFGFAFDAVVDTEGLVRFAPGLFWVTVLFVALLTLQRSVALELSDGALSGLRLSGVSGGRIFLGKTIAVVLQLLALEVLLVAGVMVFYGSRIADVTLLIFTCVVAAIGIGTAGSLYGVLAVGLGVTTLSELPW